MTVKRLAMILFVVLFWWYGVWCTFHHILGFDPVQSWLGLIAVLVGLGWFVWKDVQAADNASYTVVAEPVPPIEQREDRT